MVPSPTRLGRQPRPTVTGANRHKKKYEVNNPKVSSISLPGPHNLWQQQRHWPRTSNRQCVRGIVDSWTTTEADASQWPALGIGKHEGDVSRGRWERGIDEENGGVNWGIRGYNSSEWMSITTEAPVCLRAARGLDDDNRGVNWGGRRYNTS